MKAKKKKAKRYLRHSSGGKLLASKWTKAGKAYLKKWGYK